MVGDVGVEPTRTGHMILSHTRLPVPPIPVVAGVKFMRLELSREVLPAVYYHQLVPTGICLPPCPALPSIGGHLTGRVLIAPHSFLFRLLMMETCRAYPDRFTNLSPPVVIKGSAVHGSMVSVTGLEPVTFRLLNQCFHKLFTTFSKE